jgi:RNA polymerase sigma-70 factor (ECF subfamily)
MLGDWVSFRAVPGPFAGMNLSAMSELLARIAEASDATAFHELYQSYGPRLKAYLVRRGADAATAEDLAQETLLAVWRRAALFSSAKGSASTWIFTIARNLWIDRLRKEVPWQELPPAHAEATSPEPSPDAVVADSEVQARVRAALAELPVEQQRVLELAYQEGLSHGDIAARLGVPLGTVKSRVRMAYQRMRAAVEDLK